MISKPTTKLQSSKQCGSTHIRIDIDRRNRTESPEINVHMYEMISDKGTKTIQWGKNSPFNRQRWYSWMSTHKRMKLRPHKKINSKLIKGLSIRAKTIKFFKENTEVNLHDL